MTNLCKNCNENNRWYPKPISSLERALGILIKDGSGIDNIKEVRKNIAYNIQYLQYLNKTFVELDLSSVLIKQTYKTFIITGMSVVEALLYCVVKRNNKQNMSSWKSVKKVKTPEFIVDSKTIKIENEIFEKTESSIELVMTLDTMIKKVEKQKLLGLEHKVYGNLKKLRQLRNKVHIHAVEDKCDTDYFNFDREDFDLMKEILYELLTCDEFCSGESCKNMYEFLRID